ncbi:MAG: hypothetical protein HN368_02955 [Spirochaetales bacterium]|jgi:predicted CopG family antitoxin|nr:hypothetical protein [Spirochaetales bacterium]
MAVKTITIDMEAYTLLYEEKQGNESFSKVIKRTLKKKRKNAATFLANLEQFVFEDETIDKVENIIEARKDSLISSVILDEDI